MQKQMNAESMRYAISDASSRLTVSMLLIFSMKWSSQIYIYTVFTTHFDFQSFMESLAAKILINGLQPYQVTAKLPHEFVVTVV